MRIDPEDIVGPPPASIDVTLELRTKANGEGTELFGRPLAKAAQALAE